MDINKEIDKLIGIALESDTYKLLNNKNNWKYCDYCEKFHGLEYFLENNTYCIHCWGWLNGYDIDLEKGTYVGTARYDSFKNMLKKVYPIHLDSNCTNHDCTFLKITKYAEAQILHKNFIDLLELNKSSKQQTININFKNRNLNINFKDSYIIL